MEKQALIDDILFKNGTARLEDFYPLTKVITESNKKELLDRGYNPGYTVSEWPYSLPVDKIYYSKHLVPATYYYDPDNEVIPIVVNLNIYGKERLAIIADSDEFSKHILDFAQSLQQPDKKELTRYLFTQDDGIRSQLLAEYVRRNTPSPEVYELFFSFYKITDYSADVYDEVLMQKLVSGRSGEQAKEINNLLAEYPEELSVYRGESDGSTSYQKAFSWSLDINTAFFFACRHGDKNHARIIRAKVNKTDVIALNLKHEEKEIIALPSTVHQAIVERLIGPDSPLVMSPRYLDEYQIGISKIRLLYRHYQKDSSEHGQLHSARVLFLALTIVQAGKIKLNQTEMRQLLTAIAFHDIGRSNEDADDDHGKASRRIYEKIEGGNIEPSISFLIKYHCLNDQLASEYLETADSIRAKKRTWLLYQILKDADALDRVRFGIYELDVNQLRLPISHKLVPLAVAALNGIKM